MCGHVALGQIHGCIERRITSPWPSDLMIKIQSVHFRTDEMPVDLLFRRPTLYIECPQSLFPRSELLLLPSHSCRGVVG